MITSWQENYDKPGQCVEKQKCYSAKKVHIVKAVVLPAATCSCETWTIKKEGRAPKN